MNIYFYLPNYKSLKLDDPIWLSSQGGVVVWSALVYYFLKKYGYKDIYLTDNVPKGNGILLFHPRFSKEVFQNPNLLYVCTLADAKDKIKKADFHIVQNPILADKTSYYIPHFPQPGLIPRKKENIEIVSFKGEIQNLHPELQTYEFIKEINSFGMRFNIDTNKELWRDYSNTDITLAVRRNRKSRWKHKPITKLVNAWIAKTPVIVGDEVGFDLVKKSNLDFIKATNKEEVIKAIKKLKNNPTLFEDMVANGIERAKEYSFENISYQWMDVLEKIKKRKKNIFKKFLQKI